MEHDRIRIHFTSNREEIPGILNTCLEHVTQRTKTSPPSPEIFAKVKWVITELLTNAVKHSGTGHCTLIIKVDENRLTLQKEDKGNPLSLSEQDTGSVFTWPIENFTGKLEFQIYHNGVDSLILKSEKANQVRFYIEELEGVEMPGLLIDTSEHFGLLIMTKASDEFWYEYDPKTKINRFVSLFNLKNN
ncbi:anti-sigma regulatory factor [Dyadobacter fanqingshengii]|uniref:Anti-sigma regulatory factor n=1 Tax=Dyadobacter fanqingshengii TaxID=2906443 RepID=A0A9X1PEM3_9BACT|nr:anti-sigma regulatory factor [Dyadobacter fanqingshengii]MCF0041847.1 anti-sigma regulatory factor [Dyadobacter fanqingshengii]USJ36444.1 anti-sigma regulatory factor [Dyadobacter fanqingshengii]